MHSSKCLQITVIFYLEGSMGKNFTIIGADIAFKRKILLFRVLAS